jgi:GMP synthase (glutamine-hydrolysing)
MTALLVIKTGDAIPSISAKRRDFETWIAAGAGLSLADVNVIRVFRGEPLPEPESVPGVIVTGSPSMVTDRELWSENTARWLARALALDKPVLGICYGHQLIAHALGGDVRMNPRGREVGTVDVKLSTNVKNDPLFGAFADLLHVPAAHRQAVVRVPPRASVLGSTALDPHSIVRYGAAAWGVQFHPEFDANIVRAYIDNSREAMLTEGLDPEALWHSATDTADGTFILRRFAEIVRKGIVARTRLAESAE